MSNLAQNSMNVYEKIQSARIDLQNMQLKKSGKNDYSKYSYYELGDFLPAITKLCQNYGLMTKFDITVTEGVENAILTVFNISNPDEFITFYSPTAEVEIGKKKDGTGGAEPIQNLGGKTTYMRRYLLMTAFEMVESDVVEQINRELTGSLKESDIKKIENAKNVEDLVKVCGALKKTYREDLIIPHYEKAKAILQQERA